MKILTLSIKREWFDKILSGEKTHEYREIRPTVQQRYIFYRNNGKDYKPSEFDQIPNDESPIEVLPIKYDAIKFLTGAYSGKRPWMLVEVKDAESIVLTDDDGNDIEYEWTDGNVYVAMQMDYTLGKVLEKDLNPE